MTVLVTDIDTPVGPLRLASRDDVVLACCFVDHWDRVASPRRTGDDQWRSGPSAPARSLADYVDGDLAALDHLDVDAGGTEFQRHVWSELRRIPTGHTRSYAQVAGALGHPGAARAVGTANGRNPAWLVVPCHRVIRADGGLGGYGGGTDRKRWLLAHEGVDMPAR